MMITKDHDRQSDTQYEQPDDKVRKATANEVIHFHSGSQAKAIRPQANGSRCCKFHAPEKIRADSDASPLVTGLPVLSAFGNDGGGCLTLAHEASAKAQSCDHEHHRQCNLLHIALQSC